MRRFLSTFATFAVSETSVRSHRGRISVCRRRQFLTLPFPAGKRGSQASVRPIETSDRGRFPGSGTRGSPHSLEFWKRKREAGGLGSGTESSRRAGAGVLSLALHLARVAVCLEARKSENREREGIPWVLGLLIVLQLLGTVSRPPCRLHWTTGGR